MHIGVCRLDVSVRNTEWVGQHRWCHWFITALSGKHFYIHHAACFWLFVRLFGSCL